MCVIEAGNGEWNCKSLMCGCSDCDRRRFHFQQNELLTLNFTPINRVACTGLLTVSCDVKPRVIIENCGMLYLGATQETVII